MLGPDIRLVLVVAPAGYGKTTALSQWANSSDHYVGWAQLDEADNDPVHLLRSIALGVQQPQLAGRLRTSPPDTALDTATLPLVSFLRGLDRPAVIVLDDLQRIRRSAALDLLVTLAAKLPHGCRVVAASRRRPRMKLGRLRSQGQFAEFGPADLAFSPAEARGLLDQVEVDLGDEAVQALLEHTEGWPAGMYLAALSLAGTPDPLAAVGEIAGSSRYIVDYFRDEVLIEQSAQTVRFLLRTAALEEMSASLCDAVLDTTGSRAWLSEIEALNLFVVPQDERGEWYRYHRLFTEMLLSELRRREPGEELRIRRRAAAWFERQGLPEQAIGYAIAAQDDAAAARLITVYAQPLTSDGRVEQVRTWLEALGESVLQGYPPLAAMGAWVWAAVGDAPRAQRSLRIAESGTFDGKLPDGSASLTSAVARARAALAPYGVDAMVADAKQTLDLEPPGSPWHTAAAMLYGVACLLTGSRDEARKALERAARLGRKGERASVAFALAQQSLLAADDGDWSTAAACATESRQLMEAGGLQASLPGLLTPLACGRVALHRGDTQAAWTDTADALRLYRSPSPVAFPWLAAQAAIILGRILLDLGDEAAAQLRATEAARHLDSLLTEGVLREEYRQLLADLDRARSRSQALDATDLTKAELRVLQLLPTHLSLAEIAQELVISRNTVKSQVAAIYRKLNVANRTDAVHKGYQTGLLDR